MDLKNGVTKTKEFLRIRDNDTGWFVSDVYLWDGKFEYLSFSPIKDRAKKFEQHGSDEKLIEIILSSPFDLKVIRVTKTLIEFDNEEEVE